MIFRSVLIVPGWVLQFVGLELVQNLLEYWKAVCFTFSISRAMVLNWAEVQNKVEWEGEGGILCSCVPVICWNEYAVLFIIGAMGTSFGSKFTSLEKKFL